MGKWGNGKVGKWGLFRMDQEHDFCVPRVGVLGRCEPNLKMTELYGISDSTHRVLSAGGSIIKDVSP